jgi:hypothetical protein
MPRITDYSGDERNRLPNLGDYGFAGNRVSLLEAIKAEQGIASNPFSDLDSVVPQSGLSSDHIEGVSAEKLETGTIASQKITLAIPADGGGDAFFNAGKTDFTTTENGFILGIDDSDSNKVKFYLGNATDYFFWNGTNLYLSGAIAGRVLNVGSGADGALSVTSGTTNLSLGTIYNYSSVSITGGTLSTADTNGVMFIRCLGDFTLGASGTIDLAGKGGAGGAGAPVGGSATQPGTTGTNGFGAFNFDATTVRHGGEFGNYNGVPANANAGGGGGGAGLAAGTDQSGFASEAATDGEGGLALTNQSNITTEFAYAVWRHIFVTCGSGGGGGALNSYSTGNIAGAGGAGGGCLVVFVGGNLNISGTITVAGNDGGATTAGGVPRPRGGGGGGGGGMILFVVVGTITDTSTKTVSGGTGSSGSGLIGGQGTGYNGGAGSAGKALILSAF